MQTHEQVLFSFERLDEEKRWFTIDDVVMGGVSSSLLQSTGDGSAIFSGIVSLEHNGGFASIRSAASTYDLSGYNGIRLFVRGDGKRYAFRVNMTDAFDTIGYQSRFVTQLAKWQNVILPFSEQQPMFRGRSVPDAPPLDCQHIRAFGFLIADKQAGPFQLELARIVAYT